MLSASTDAVTGMVGYPESVTDPSFRGQILVMTWPLIGNYGVPSRDIRDPLLESVPAYFEAAKIHITGLVIASYAGEDYSHHLASSSLGDWLKENDVPAVYGVDTRALTKRIRQKGSMLCRMLLQKDLTGAASSQGQSDINSTDKKVSTDQFEHVEWSDPNDRNLVIEGEIVMNLGFIDNGINYLSLVPRTAAVLSESRIYSSPSLWPAHSRNMCGFRPEIQSATLLGISGR